MLKKQTFNLFFYRSNKIRIILMILISNLHLVITNSVFIEAIPMLFYNFILFNLQLVKVNIKTLQINHFCYKINILQ
jgi:hypothetical protein